MLEAAHIAPSEQQLAATPIEHHSGGTSTSPSVYVFVRDCRGEHQHRVSIMAQQQQSSQQAAPPKPVPYVPSKKPRTDYPLIDNDPHFFRVCRFARPSDYAWAAGMALMPPGLLAFWEQVSPSHVGKGGFAPVMRLAVGVGAAGGFLLFYQNSLLRFYGVTENQREIDKDMREMVAKVKAGKPLYGQTELSDYMQGVASRNSRYTGVFLHVVPMFNFVNHNQHGVDTAKYFQQAERELEAERLAKGVKWNDG